MGIWRLHIRNKPKRRKTSETYVQQRIEPKYKSPWTPRMASFYLIWVSKLTPPDLHTVWGPSALAIRHRFIYTISTASPWQTLTSCLNVEILQVLRHIRHTAMAAAAATYSSLFSSKANSPALKKKIKFLRLNPFRDPAPTTTICFDYRQHKIFVFFFFFKVVWRVIWAIRKSLISISRRHGRLGVTFFVIIIRRLTPSRF